VNDAKPSEEAAAWHRRFAAAGETEKHRASYGLALAAIEAVSNEEEKRIVARTFRHVPKP
jgi:hypothetical protein